MGWALNQEWKPLCDDGDRDPVISSSQPGQYYLLLKVGPAPGSQWERASTDSCLTRTIQDTPREQQKAVFGCDSCFRHKATEIPERE